MYIITLISKDYSIDRLLTDIWMHINLSESEVKSLGTKLFFLVLCISINLDICSAGSFLT